VKIIINKSPIPIIWLDTFFLIELYKAKDGNRNDERVTSLRRLLLKKVHDKKIICGISDQIEELEEDVYETISSFLPLTRGVRFNSSIQIIENQKLTMMECYLRKRDECILDYRQALWDNFETKINNKNPISVNVIENPTIEQLEKQKMKKNALNKQIQNLKETYCNGKSFEEQLENEYLGTYYATRSMVTKLGNMQHDTSDNEFEDMELYAQYYNFIFLPITYWAAFGGEFSFEEYFSYLKSSEFMMLPYIKITAILMADILTSKKTLPSGDIKDIDNMATLMPYCNFFLTDDAQRRRTNRLFGENNIYGTKIFSLKTIDELIFQIENLD
jgi:hypothetical protein